MQELEPVLILYKGVRAVKYIPLYRVATRLTVGCRKHKAEAQLVVEETVPGEGFLFELERGSDYITMTVFRGNWGHGSEAVENDVPKAKKIVLEAGSSFSLLETNFILQVGDSSDILSDSVSDEQEDEEWGVEQQQNQDYDNCLNNYENYGGAGKIIYSKRAGEWELEADLEKKASLCGSIRTSGGPDAVRKSKRLL